MCWYKKDWIHKKVKHREAKKVQFAGSKFVSQVKIKP